MPTILLRGLDADTSARVKTYARAHDLSVSDAAAQLLRIALDHLEARAAGGRAVREGRTAAEASEAGRRAVAMRWARR